MNIDPIGAGHGAIAAVSLLLSLILLVACYGLSGATLKMGPFLVKRQLSHRTRPVSGCNETELLRAITFWFTLF